MYINVADAFIVLQHIRCATSQLIKCRSQGEVLGVLRNRTHCSVVLHNSPGGWGGFSAAPGRAGVRALSPAGPGPAVPGHPYSRGSPL